MNLEQTLRELLASGQLNLPLPGRGNTAQRHRALLELACRDLSLGRLAEAHTDAIAILADAGRDPAPGALYGVWAAESPNTIVELNASQEGLRLSGVKMFCSGAGLIDRALVTVGTTERRLVDIPLRDDADSIAFDMSSWNVPAFADTRTATAQFVNAKVPESAVLGPANWYLDRPGFWHGACGPAACWAGGAISLIEYARQQTRDDPHTFAHLGALHADEWLLRACLDQAGDQIDADPDRWDAARLRALSVRHWVEQCCMDVQTRLGRAYGPRALIFEPLIAAQRQRLDLYIRQCHAERDLEVIGRAVKRQVKRS